MKKIFYFVFLLIIIVTGCENKKDTERIAQLESENKSLESKNAYLKSQQTSVEPTYHFNNSESNNNTHSYSSISDDSLLEEFKNYMSDNNFQFDSFNKNNKGIFINATIADNVSVRRLERGNPALFDALLERFKLIKYTNIFGTSVTLKHKP